MKKVDKKVIVVVSIISAIVVFFLFYTTTGFYCKVPVFNENTEVPSSPGETVFFLRRGTSFRFITSADGLAMEQGFSPNNAIRAQLDTEFERLAKRRIIIRFGFSRNLYLKTSDNNDFYSPVSKNTGSENKTE